MKRLQRIVNHFFMLTLMLLSVQEMAYGALLSFSGSATQMGGMENVAFEAWDDAEGRPKRTVTFDSVVLSTSSVLLDAYPGGILVGTAAEPFFAVEAGGNSALFPLFVDGDNLVGKEEGSGFIGLSNLSDLTAPNENLLLLGSNNVLQVNFDDINNNMIREFGTTTAVGGFFSTTSQVSLELFDFDANSLGIFSATPGTLDPFFLGIVNDTGVANIATARFSLSGSGAFDGLVFASAVDAGMTPPTQPLLATVPLPAGVWLFGSGLAGLVFLRRKIISQN